jgi:hypothetical protein
MKIKSSFDLRVATLSGAVVCLQAGVERDVSEAIGAIAIGMGAEAIGVSVQSTPEPVEFAPAAPDTEPLFEVVEAIEELINVGSPADFKASGEPKVASIHRVMGKQVSSELREAAWEQVLNG